MRDLSLKIIPLLRQQHHDCQHQADIFFASAESLATNPPIASAPAAAGGAAAAAAAAAASAGGGPPGVAADGAGAGDGDGDGADGSAAVSARKRSIFFFFVLETSLFFAWFLDVYVPGEVQGLGTTADHSRALSPGIFELRYRAFVQPRSRRNHFMVFTLLAWPMHKYFLGYPGVESLGHYLTRVMAG